MNRQNSFVRRSQKTMEKPAAKPFGVRDQVGYMFGDMAGSFVNLLIDAYFLTFCTYVLNIDPKWMGSLFLFARLWDAFNDPMIGSFPDRWQIGKSGDKFKPYVRIAMIPLAISALLCFADVSSFSSTLKHVWVAAAYVIYGMSYTGTSMPYGSMAAVITNDPVERTKLSRARSIGGTIVGIGALSLVPQFVFDSTGNVSPKGFFGVAIVFGICSILCYLVLLTLTTERVRQPRGEKQKFNYGKVIKGVLHNRQMLGVMLASVGSLLYITGNSQLGSYLYKEYYHAPKVLTLVSLISIPVMVVCFPLIPKLSQKFGKRAVILFASGYNLVISTILFLVPIPNVYLYLVLSTLAVSGQTVFTMLVWAFVTDCVDYQEYKTGERSDGSLYSIYTFSRKIGSTLASTLASYGLAAIGFVSGAAVQSEAFAVNVRALCTAIPVITCILELVGIGLIYNLNKERTEKMYSELNARREQAQ